MKPDVSRITMHNMQINATTLGAQPFFKGLPTELLEMLAKEAMPVEFKNGDLIFSEGGVANRLYLILSGKVILESSMDSEHEPVTIETIGPGGLLGWSWLFPPYYWIFDARADSPVNAIFFYGTRLREQCEINHELGYELMKRVSAVVIERLQATRHCLAEQNKTLLMPI
jgi:CRP/FNR family transcriptional regulator, cyclic AMP receptor protein